MGLIVDVYRRPADMDCSLNGISEQFTELVLVNVDGPFEPKSNRPAAILESHQPGCLRIVPAEKLGNGYVKIKSWTMMGGNYGATSDSRFSEACEKLLGHCFYGAVPIHDRIES
jgi:hypothetical protein